MFGLFKNNKNAIRQDEIDFLSRVLMILPKEYDFLNGQIQAGLLKKAIRGSKYTENYVGFGYDTSVLKKFADESRGFFRIKGIIVSNDFDSYELNLFIIDSVINGYSVSKQFDGQFSFNNIDVKNCKREYFENVDYDKVSRYLTEAEKKAINSAEVYEVELDGRRYYHIKDIGDGDFIGINKEKRVFRITHDPFAIEELEGGLLKHLIASN